MTRPIAIYRHAPSEGPGFLAEFLTEHQWPWQLVAIDEGAAVPTHPEAFSGLVFMGGPMSVNDDLPWIAPVLQLIRQAVAQQIPLLGHCLGGQLLSKALGGVVSANPVKEIGWWPVEASDPLAAHWLGATTAFHAFHWHGETFSIPEGATAFLRSAACAHQAFALGPHLGFQCHVEMTPAMVAQWCAVGADEIAAANSPYVQSAADMLAVTAERVAEQQQVARQVYGQWLQGLRS